MGTTIGLYVLTTIAAALIGVFVSVLFSSLYTLKDGVGGSVVPAVKIGCSLDSSGNPESFLTEQADGSIVCVENGGSGNNTVFVIDDINGYFQVTPGAKGPPEISLSDSVYQVRRACILVL